MVSGADVAALITLTDTVAGRPWIFMSAYEVHHSELQYVGTPSGPSSDPFVLASATVTGPTAATILASAPATKGPWSKFIFAVSTEDGRTIIQTSPTPMVQFKALTADTIYTVRAVAIGSTQSLAVNPMTFTTPAIAVKGCE